MCSFNVATAIREADRENCRRRAGVTGRYSPPSELLQKRRLRRLADAALAFEKAHRELQEARREFGYGTPESRAAVEARKAARRGVLYHASELRREREG